jgi:hypothetical protein
LLLLIFRNRYLLTADDDSVNITQQNATTVLTATATEDVFVSCVATNEAGRGRMSDATVSVFGDNG